MVGSIRSYRRGSHDGPRLAAWGRWRLSRVISSFIAGPLGPVQGLPPQPGAPRPYTFLSCDALAARASVIPSSGHRLQLSLLCGRRPRTLTPSRLSPYRGSVSHLWPTPSRPRLRPTHLAAVLNIPLSLIFCPLSLPGWPAPYAFCTVQGVTPPSSPRLICSVYSSLFLLTGPVVPGLLSLHDGMISGSLSCPAAISSGVQPGSHL